ncbi:hypothetical protein AADM51_25515, partial [Escherichia coli]
GQLLIVHGNSAYFFGEKSIPPSAAGFPSTPIHDCRTYYLNSGFLLFLISNAKMAHIVFVMQIHQAKFP